ncbi:MAG: transcription-repair coupling factor [Acidimicrobiales bacterium]
MTSPLSALPALLEDDPALTAVLGRRDATLAVPEPARALVLAGLAHRSERRPLLVVTPTGAEADRLGNDLRQYLGNDAVDVFPAWETLPFERVSPSVETMGRRLRTLWALSDPATAPAVVVAPVRAVAQRLCPHAGEIEPLVVGVGDRLDVDELLRQLVALGYRREHQVEHRGEVAVRGSIVDVFPSTADVPIRIDLWGDEVDRLTEFSVADQRTKSIISEIEVFGCREVVPTDDVRERAEALLATDPWGVEQWDKLREGQFFEGMESWLPWLAADEAVLPDLMATDSLIVLVEPRRLRDRAVDLLAEEDDLASTLARTWGAIAEGEDASSFPRLHVEFDRLLASTDAPVWTMGAVPESPDVATVAATGWDPAVGEGATLPQQLRRLLDDGYRVFVGADGAGTASRLGELLTQQGLDFVVADDIVDATPPGGRIIVAPLERGCVLTDARLAVLAESDVTGRRRSHRRARRRPSRDSQGFFDDLAAGDYVVHYHHGVARFGGMVTRGIGGVDRDYLLLEYRGGDKLYVPSDQIDAVRHYTGGESPTLSRMGGADFEKSKAKVRSAVQEIAQELVVLYQARVNATGHAYDPDSPWQHELEDSFPYEETPDQQRAIDEVKADMERESPMDRLVCGDVGFGKTEIALRAAFKAIQSGKQVALLVPTTLLAQQHYQTFADRFAGYPVRVEVLSRFLTPGQAKAVIGAVGDGEVDLIIGTHRLLSDDVAFARLGLLIVDEEQRFGVSHKEAIKAMRTDIDVLTLTATPIPRTLEQVVLDFWEGEYDVLVCTTIIESGIDMPTVNTLVVDRADLLGLGQLHQLRGRVGRSGSRAYAYLFFPPDRSLSEEAYERLKTIGETTELGSGFKIAMRDLEIRGAGNLLGTGQSGHIAAVGYDLYCQMVTEAVAELKGETPDPPAEIKIELPVDAYLDPSYVEREEHRLEAYRRLAVVDSHEQVDDIEGEWLDRYGPVPESAQALLRVAHLRAECARIGLTDITVTKGPGFGGPDYVVRASPLTLPTSKQIRLERLFPESVFKAEPQQLQLALKGKHDLIERIMAALGELVPPDPKPVGAAQ